jgi:hypothetical protein
MCERRYGRVELCSVACYRLAPDGVHRRQGPHALWLSAGEPSPPVDTCIAQCIELASATSEFAD